MKNDLSDSKKAGDVNPLESLWKELSRISGLWADGFKKKSPEYKASISSLEKEFSSIYDKFRLHFYMQVFSRFEKREATLTTVEAFSMDCINAMDHPTVAEFARMMNISAPNAAYRVNSLVQKGYLKKTRSTEDQRSFYLEPSEKYMKYYAINIAYLDMVCDRCRDRFSPEDFDKLQELLHIINEELMPELALTELHREH